MDNPDDAGPTLERLIHAGGFYTDVGRKERRRVAMQDDTLGRAWMRQKISGEEYTALRRYALHWLAGGLSGHLGSVDLNRVLAHDPSAMSGLSKTEKQAEHRDAYHAARKQIGYLHPEIATVADHVACHDYTLVETGILLGYRSEAHARVEATKLLVDAGVRLWQFWRDRDRD